MEKIMLNTNVYSRPLDDLSDKSVRLEADAAKKIFSLSHSKAVSIFTSEILFYEIDFIKEKDRREVIFHLAKNVQKEFVLIDDDIENLAVSLQVFIKDYADCLHMASAATSKCSHLVTCDKELLRKAEKIESFLLKRGIMLHILNPVEFIGVLRD